MLVSLVTISTVAQTPQGRAHLVVGITVDQLRTDYIEFLKEKFGERGFRKLMSEGLYAKDTEFGIANPDATNATAMIYTGTYPRQNGITAATSYDPATLKREPALTDKNARQKEDAYTPASLLLSTISDEVMIDGMGLSSVYSLSTDPRTAVIMAGHAGTGAYWINENTGKWTGSGYYSAPPQPVQNRNRVPLSRRIDSIHWQPSLHISEYKALPAQKSYYPFSYTFSTSDREVYRRFLASPMANREVTDLAIDFLKTLKVGQTGGAIDMLSLGYTAAPYKYVKDGDYRFELQDTYIKLDAQIERLLDAIDRYVGLDNTVLFLTSTGYYDDAVADEEKYRIPGGEFSSKRAVSLLNAYLSARHGAAGYIADLSNGQLYLDHKTLDAAGLDAALVATEARDFICRMSGVADAMTISSINDGATERDRRYRHSLRPENSGDVVVEFLGGWTVADDLHYPAKYTPQRSAAVLTPTFILAPELKAEVLTEPLPAIKIAPTVTSLLHIRSPNGAQSAPLAR